jgi:hypothetical protein
MDKGIIIAELGNVELEKRKFKELEKLIGGPVKFKNLEEREVFMRFTKIIPQKKALQLPFKNMGQYLDEYNLIMQKNSKLRSAERIQVKNIIHQQVRLGKITLTIE